MKYVSLFFLFLAPILAAGQATSMPDMPGMTQQPVSQGQQGHAGHDMSQMQNTPEHPMYVMSGTHEEPASTPAPMWMKQARAWTLMAHGNLFLTGNFQGGPRGLHKFESMNWVMFMESRKLGKGTLELRQMLSADRKSVV